MKTGSEGHFSTQQYHDPTLVNLSGHEEIKWAVYLLLKYIENRSEEKQNDPTMAKSQENSPLKKPY